MSFVIIPKILWTVSLIALFLSAANDLKERIIPNELVLVIALSGLLICLTMRPGQICLSLVAGALVFLALGVLCHCEAIAGGDAKLMVAVTLLVPPGDIGELLMGIALAGGVLSCVYLGASYMVRNPCGASGDAPRGNAVSSVAEWARVETIRIASRKQVPYAIAILGGVIWCVSRERLLMFFRNALLVLGVFCILGGVAIGYVWLTSQDASVEVAKPEMHGPEPQQPARIAVMSASRDIASGTLLQPGDILWKEIAPSELRPGNLARGQASEGEFIGALAKRDFANGEALNANDLLKQNDRRFLAAALKPGARAISIPVDATQSAYGLIEPGNYVDVILTQSLSDQPGDAKRKVVAETILQNIRVIAVDQTLTQQARTSLATVLSTEPRLPKTVTLELTKEQAESVYVALQLGRLQFSLRSIEENPSAAADHAEHRTATWAGDVSPALRQMPHAPLQGPASSLESAIRRPPGFLQ